MRVRRERALVHEGVERTLDLRANGREGPRCQVEVARDLLEERVRTVVVTARLRLVAAQELERLRRRAIHDLRRAVLVAQLADRLRDLGRGHGEERVEHLGRRLGLRLDRA